MITNIGAKTITDIWHDLRKQTHTHLLSLSNTQITAGRYEYKYVLDEITWTHCEKEPKIGNDLGVCNNVSSCDVCFFCWSILIPADLYLFCRSRLMSPGVCFDEITWTHREKEPKIGNGMGVCKKFGVMLVSFVGLLRCL